MTRLLERIACIILGPRCNVTGEHVYPKDRVAHELQHLGEGACA